MRVVQYYCTVHARNHCRGVLLPACGYNYFGWFTQRISQVFAKIVLTASAQETRFIISMVGHLNVLKTLGRFNHPDRTRLDQTTGPLKSTGTKKLTKKSQNFNITT